MRIIFAAIFSLVLVENSFQQANATQRTNISSKAPGDAREKRNLYQLGNHAFNQQQQLQHYQNRAQFQRRISSGYPAETRAYFPPPPQTQYSYSSLYPGQSQHSVIHQEPSNNLYEPAYYPQPQYLEAPEPIIEIIIKESNETLPAPAPQSYAPKKKKEHVQVFYVKYKKDHNNQLQLEAPVAALAPDTEHLNIREPEEEEIGHYPPPPLQNIPTTTLRTIIHPDSEKFHSNSGIHVTFNTEDKNQLGHEIQEHNEESVVQSVVALPGRGNVVATPTERPKFIREETQSLQGNSRQDFRSEPRQIQNFGTQQYKQQQFPQQHQPFISHHQPHNPPSPPTQSFRHLQQQVPPYQMQISHQSHKTQHHHMQHQIIHNQSAFQAPRSQPISSPPTRSNFKFPSQGSSSSTKNQNYQYQTIKFGEEAPPPPSPPQSQHKPIPIPIQNTPQHLHQHYQQSFNRALPPNVGQPEHAFPQNFQTQEQHTKAAKTPVRNPNIIPLPAHIQQNSLPQLPAQQFREQASNYFPLKTQNLVKQDGQSFNSNSQSGSNVSGEHHTASLFNSISPTTSELVKSVSKYEQHITETVNSDQSIQPFGSRYQSENHYQPSHDFLGSNALNNVIHHIPAPQLGPKAPESNVNHPENHQLTGASSTLSPFHPQFFTTPPSAQQQRSQHEEQAFSSTIFPQQYQSSTPATQQQQQHHQQQNQQHQQQQNQQHQQQQQQQQLFSIQSSDNDKIQVVTPVSTNGFHQHGSFSSNQQQFQNVAQPQLIFNSQPIQHHQPQPQPQTQPQQLQLPQSQTIQQQQLPIPGQSVSTLHTAALPEIEQRNNVYYSQNQLQSTQARQPQSNTFVEIAASNKFAQNSDRSQTQHRFANQQLIPTTSTQTPPTTTSRTTKTPHIQLPDEVPENLRNHLLSSGILDNADISVLDYDKEGGIDLANLPPEHLSHFYSNGGGAQISESNKVLSIVKPNGEKVNFSEKQIEKVREILPKQQKVDLKVVRFDAINQKSVTDKYIKPDSTILPAVDVETSKKQYNKYLPLKVNGTNFPIPDAEELRGKKITSVVVLAPVDSLQTIEENVAKSSNDLRQERDILSKEVKFIAGESLKQLLIKPNRENFKKWLDKESKTDIDLQSVVLLTAKNSEGQQEIYMYEIANQFVNKLSGKLSTAFVNVAEENATFQDIANTPMKESGIVVRSMPTHETVTRRNFLSTEMELKDDLDVEPAQSDDDDDDEEGAASQIHETVVKLPQLSSIEKSSQAHSDQIINKISINSGYSVIKS